ncbi:hypothetical protein BUE67_14510, partial [Corynebacterium diphtheriae]
MDAVGGRGVDPFGLSPVVAGFTTGSGVGSDASSDAQGLFATASIPGVAGAPGLGLTRAGSVQVAGLEILGARVYDATTRGFALASVDAVGGRGVDPFGLSPVVAGFTTGSGVG